MLVLAIVSPMRLQTLLLVQAMEGVDVRRIWPDGEGIYNARLILFLGRYSPPYFSQLSLSFLLKCTFPQLSVSTWVLLLPFHPKTWANILPVIPKF